MGILLPATLVAAIVFSIITISAFHMNSPTAGFIFITISSICWIAIIVEFMLVYEALIDNWFSKDRSVIAAIWFVISIFLAIELTCDKGVSTATFLTAMILFPVIFMIPYILGVRYGAVIMRPLQKMYDRLFKHGKAGKGRNIDAVISSSPISPRMRQDDECELYGKMIGELDTTLVKGLPDKLQSNDALFLLVLFREDGYLDQDLKPTITREQNEINQTLYAFIADVISMALTIHLGKWSTFEEISSLRNGAQLLSNFKAQSKANPTEHQKRIAKLMRKATRLRPRLETTNIEELLRQY